MSLSHQERRTLQEIERGLQSDDPALAGRLAAGTWASGASGRPGRMAWFGLLLGLQVTLVGFAAAAGLISFGVIIGLYGLLLFAGSFRSLLRDRSLRRAYRILVRRRR